MTNEHWPYKDKRGRVHLTIWRNSRDDGSSYYSVDVSRRYNRAKDGEAADWQTTYKMDERDVLDAAKLFTVADDVIAEAKKLDRGAHQEAA